MDTYTVTGAIPKGHVKQLTLALGDKKSVFVRVPRYAPVGKGDALRVVSAGLMGTPSADPTDEMIRVLPHFEKGASITVGSNALQALVTEVHRAEDVEALNFLEQFHYKTHNFLSLGDEEDAPDPASVTGSRRAILIIYAKVGEGWQAAGYIELQMPLMMCGPRRDLFQAPFKHPDRSVSWSTWDASTIKRHVNIIVRIARVVVSPEFRGLGLAKTLVDSAKEYARERWHIRGHRPLFMEISAEMLKYVDFVTSSDFRFVGTTEGNLGRIVKDLKSMARGYAANFGIMTLQKKYLSTIQRYCKATEQTFESVTTRLQEIVSAPDPASALTPDEWAAFRSVLRFPIPYYLCGLDDYTQQYLNHAASRTSPASKRFKFKAPSTSVTLDHLNVQCEVRLTLTKNVRMIMDAFGLKGDGFLSELVPPINIRASNGNIFLIVGSSGTGKSVLLNALDPSASEAKRDLRIKYKGQIAYEVSWLHKLPAEMPIFDYFADKYGPEKSFAALSQVGLSEALSLIKPFRNLSRGQQYRAMLADMLLRDSPVWLLDEFCSDLDPLTARIVAHNFRKHVISSGRIAFVAAANHGHFFDALRPTRVITMRMGSQATISSFKEYKDELLAASL